MSKLVIVEGTCGAGKTTLLRAASQEFLDREVVVVGQNTTYGPIVPAEDAGTVSEESNVTVLNAVIASLQAVLAQRECLVLVDTLHFTHFVRLRVLSHESLRVIDQAVGELSPLVVALQISEASIRDRTIAARRGTGFYEYARKFGRNEDELASYFYREQEQLLRLISEHSVLPHRILNGDVPPTDLTDRFVTVVEQHFPV